MQKPRRGLFHYRTLAILSRLDDLRLPVRTMSSSLSNNHMKHITARHCYRASMHTTTNEIHYEDVM